MKNLLCKIGIHIAVRERHCCPCGKHQFPTLVVKDDPLSISECIDTINLLVHKYGVEFDFCAWEEIKKRIS